MRKRTAEDEEFFEQMAEMLGQEEADRFADAWLSMSDEGRNRYVRLAEHVASLPSGMKLTEEQKRLMIENDAGPSLH